ncbi:MAG: 23S rRNA (adenine(2503)-C(2))-methyltransferase RlmN [Candidatus Nanoarchaeia archaeon]
MSHEKHNSSLQLFKQIYPQIVEFLEEKKTPPFRIKQIQHAIFKEYITQFSQITTLPKYLREELDSTFSLQSFTLLEAHSTDEVTKLLFKTFDGEFVESVIIFHHDGRKTLCVSSQIFCAVGCKFCATGATTFKRSLNVQEMVEQLLFAQKYVSSNFDDTVSNIVFMGMGEPLLNFKVVKVALEAYNHPDFFGIGARHITLSTSGVLPKLKEFIQMPQQFKLAISLHAANNELRTEIMPINKRYPLDELMAVCDEYVALKNKRVSYEYVIINGVNDTLDHAQELVDLLSTRKAHLNLLMYNEHEFSDYTRPKYDTVMNFYEYVKRGGVEVSLRKSMGKDSESACGQLSGHAQKEKDKKNSKEMQVENSTQAIISY